MTEVVIAIPTYHRPQGLEKLLRALEKLETDANVSIIVGDNDPETHEGFTVCASLKANYRWPLACILVSARGIAQNRNALVEEALKTPGMDFLAMIDDDEWPVPHWLDAMLAVQKQTGADAVAGAVEYQYERDPGRLAAHCGGLAPVHGKTGPSHEIDSTANVLMHRSCFDGGRRFDPEFALTGGEDRDFFTRLAREGKRFAWADEALVYAHVPTSRANLSWSLTRAYRTGNSDMRVMLKYGLSARETVREVGKIAAAFVLAVPAFVIFVFDASRSANAVRRVFRASGKIAAFFGRHYNEYAVTHGK
jgi:glycosyltransferase involved in cell wall biosynthesis